MKDKATTTNNNTNNTAHLQQTLAAARLQLRQLRAKLEHLERQLMQDTLLCLQQELKGLRANLKSVQPERPATSAGAEDEEIPNRVYLMGTIQPPKTP